MIIDKKLFWNEVTLLAKNNYGPWKNKQEAQRRINWAMKDTCDHIVNELYRATDDEFVNLLNEMTA